MSAEINVFIDDGVGHIKVLVGPAVESYTAEGLPVFETEPDVARIVAIYNGLTAALTADDAHKLGREAPRGGSGRGGAPARPASVADGPPCEFCESPSYQNTSKAGKPYLKCSKKACGAVAPFKDRDTNEWVWKADEPR